MNIAEALDNELAKLPENSERAFIQLDLEGNKEKQTVALVFELDDDKHWKIKASAGLEHIEDKLDWEVKGQVRYAW